MSNYSILLLFFLLVSCQSAKHSTSCPNFKGLSNHSISLNKQKKVSKKKKAEKKSTKEKPIDLLVSHLNLPDLLTYEETLQPILIDSVCPLVILQDQTVIYADVKSVQNDSMLITPCDSSGNSFQLSKSQIWSIEYNPDESSFNKDKEFDLKEYKANTIDEPKYDEYKNKRKAKNMALFSLVLGLNAILGAIFIIGILFAIPAIILGVKSLKIYNTYPEYTEGRKMAVAGKVLGIIAILLAVLVFVLFMIFIRPWF